jgi:Secretion system C-terminal sorting domain
MKKSLLLVIFSCLFCFANAQNIQIVDPVTNVVGSSEEIAYINLHVKNNSASTQEIYLQRTIVSLVPGHLSYFCFGITCYPPGVSKSPDNLVLAAGSTDESVKTYIDPRSEVGVSTVNYCYYNLAKTDSACLLLTYDMALTGILNNSHLKFVKVFPNPADDHVNLAFNTEKVYSSSEIQITDLNGRIVTSEPVSTKEGLIKVDVSNLPSGIYVCNLVADGVSIARDKVIIK